jgi:carbon-monoxide dehydrogenase large subunit
VRAKALRLAASLLQCTSDDLTIAEGRVVRRAGVAETGLDLALLAARLAGTPGIPLPDGFAPGLEATDYAPIGATATASGTHIAEVEVDPATGAVAVVAYVVAHDCGNVLNPLLVDGQILGGVVHGIGNALFEQMVYDPTGQPLSSNYGEYLLPLASEMPRIDIAHIETPSPHNPLGAKGAGEGGTIPAAAAIISALEDALREEGARFSKHPVSPEDVIEAIHLGLCIREVVPSAGPGGSLLEIAGG